MINELAKELNNTLSGTTAGALLSDMGLRLYFPNGIIAQGGEAAKSASFANGTIGMAVANGTPIELDTYKKSMPDFNSRETVAYAKTAGNPDLRKIWKEKNSSDVFFSQTVRTIGDMYRSGQGVEKDEEKAQEKAQEYYQWAKELNSR